MRLFFLLSLIFDSLSLSLFVVSWYGRDEWEIDRSTLQFQKKLVLGTLGRCGPECGMEPRQLPSRPSNQVCPHIIDVRVEWNYIKKYAELAILTVLITNL